MGRNPIWTEKSREFLESQEPPTPMTFQEIFDAIAPSVVEHKAKDPQASLTSSLYNSSDFVVVDLQDSGGRRTGVGLASWYHSSKEWGILAEAAANGLWPPLGLPKISQLPGLFAETEKSAPAELDQISTILEKANDRRENPTIGTADPFGDWLRAAQAALPIAAHSLTEPNDDPRTQVILQREKGAESRINELDDRLEKLISLLKIENLDAEDPDPFRGAIDAMKQAGVESARTAAREEAEKLIQARFVKTYEKYIKSVSKAATAATQARTQAEQANKIAADLSKEVKDHNNNSKLAATELEGKKINRYMLTIGVVSLVVGLLMALVAIQVAIQQLGADSANNGRVVEVSGFRSTILPGYRDAALAIRLAA